jgi:hypothetical protein
MDVYNPALQLVKWLTTQTERQGQCWHIDGDIISAGLRDASSIQFQVYCEPSSLRTWSLLTVCNARGIALRRVTPEALSDGNSVSLPLSMPFSLRFLTRCPLLGHPELGTQMLLAAVVGYEVPHNSMSCACPNPRALAAIVARLVPKRAISQCRQAFWVTNCP